MGSPISRETFLARAVARFGNRYDYGAIVYKSFKTPVTIRCTIHPVRDIKITPEKHLQTTGGCKFCLRERRLQILERDFAAEAAPDHPLGDRSAEELRPTTLSEGLVDAVRRS